MAVFVDLMDMQEIPTVLPDRWIPILENYMFRLLNHMELEYGQSDTAIYSVKFQLRFTCKENRHADLPLSVLSWSSSDVPTKTVLAGTAEQEVSKKVSN